jgi:hypothetical protein
METLNAEVQRLTDKLRQSNATRQLAEQRAAREAQAAKEALAQCDSATKARNAAQLEAERTSELASKLTKQVSDLQQQLSEDWLQRTVLQKTIDTYAEEIKHLKNVQDMLDEEKRSTQKLEAQLAEEQKNVATLREEFHARVLGNKTGSLEECADLLRPKLSDDQCVDAFCDLLKRNIGTLAAPEALKIKRQLLFCFHPDKNPGLGVATRITQLLNAVNIGNIGNIQSSPARPRHTAAASARGTPSRARSPSQPAEPRCCQSARPRCRG